MKKRQILYNNHIKFQQAVYILGINKETLNVWRCTKRYDVPYIKVGSCVMYRKSDLDKWLDLRTCGSH